MRQIPGAPALSAFRLSKLLTKLAAREPGVQALDARFVHFIDVSRALRAHEERILESLLTYGPHLEARAQEDGERVWVVPRSGTISPWSSKATDIAHVCGLAAVRRIERGVEYRLLLAQPLGPERLAQLSVLLCDRMTEMALFDAAHAARLFTTEEPRPVRRIAVGEGPAALQRANRELGLALSSDEMAYLLAHYARLGRDPTDVELMMFAQANSEHCRHKIFNAEWRIDGQPRAESLFAMIRHTYGQAPRGILSAYRDNAAVIEGPQARRYFADPGSSVYAAHAEPIDILMKVETHNHPTA